MCSTEQNNKTNQVVLHRFQNMQEPPGAQGYRLTSMRREVWGLHLENV